MVNTLYVANGRYVSFILQLAKPIEYTTTRVSPSVSYELWVIIMSQFWFISCNKCTTVVKNVDNGVSYANMSYLFFH